jgi:hypothetical protein
VRVLTCGLGHASPSDAGFPRLEGGAVAGEGRVALAGAARLELVTGARQLHPEDAMFDAMGHSETSDI